MSVFVSAGRSGCVALPSKNGTSSASSGAECVCRTEQESRAVCSRIPASDLQTDRQTHTHIKKICCFLYFVVCIMSLASVLNFFLFLTAQVISM